MFLVPDLQQLKSQRLSLGISQQDLARLAGVSQSLIAKIEAGRIDPSLSNAQRIAKALADYAPKGAMVKEVMAKNILSFPPQTPVLEAIRVMKKRGISQVPVLKDNVVVGRVTEGSILDHAENLQQATLEQVMLQPPPMVDESTPVASILPLLRTFSSVLVLKGGRLAGIVTKADVMGTVVGQKL